MKGPAPAYTGGSSNRDPDTPSSTKHFTQPYVLSGFIALTPLRVTNS